jgi:hypothetical protein
LVTARFKAEFMRARPAQVWPGIAPMIDTPAHPAYPSGHALQAYLIEHCVSEAAPAMSSALRELSAEVAVNRERAGVHWPSDKEGSWAIVPEIMRVLRSVPSFDCVLQAARQEWDAPVGKDCTAVVVVTEEREGQRSRLVSETETQHRIMDHDKDGRTRGAKVTPSKSPGQGRARLKKGAAPLSERSKDRAGS